MRRLALAPDRQLARPRRQPDDRRGGEVLGQRRDLEVVVVGEVVGLGHHPSEVGLEALVVAAVHPQEGGVGRQERAQLDLVGPDALDQGLGVVGHGRPVAVAHGQVLGPDARPVGPPPPEGGAVDGGGHAPPHHRVVEAGLAQELGHLGHVAEHVGQVADGHRPPEGGRPLHAHLEVADEGLAGDEELVGEDVPRADGDAPGRRQPAEAGLGLGAEGEVVVDRRHLPVEEEVGDGGVGLQPVEDVVEHVDQPQAEGLERLVPLTVPVRVGDDGDGPDHGRQGYAGAVANRGMPPFGVQLRRYIHHNCTPTVRHPLSQPRPSSSVPSKSVGIGREDLESAVRESRRSRGREGRAAMQTPG